MGRDRSGRHDSSSGSTAGPGRRASACASQASSVPLPSAGSSPGSGVASCTRPTAPGWSSRDPVRPRARRAAPRQESFEPGIETRALRVRASLEAHDERLSPPCQVVPQHQQPFAGRYLALPPTPPVDPHRPPSRASCPVAPTEYRRCRGPRGRCRGLGDLDREGDRPHREVVSGASPRYGAGVRETRQYGRGRPAEAAANPGGAR